MNESLKTIAFVSVAAALVGLAYASHVMNQPKSNNDFELVGKPFYENFTSSEQAKSLDVAAVDKDSLALQEFSIQNVDGLWRIPSHHNYPAEAAVRLAQTATSVMGIDRESLAGRLASDHEKLGVMDPLSEGSDDPESIGKRITLKDASGDVVVDYIIGKEAGDVKISDSERQLSENTSSQSKYYYIRRPDEQQTYKVKLDIDLSTRFSDWIDPDLLRVEPNQLTRIFVDNFSLEQDGANRMELFKVQGDQLELTRPLATDDWKLAGLNAEQEELQLPRIEQIMDVVSELKITGVRPKFKYKDHLLLTADLKLNQQPVFKENPQEFQLASNQMQMDLEQKGFSLAGSMEKLELVSQHGQIQIGTNEGVLYTLQVGKEAEGEAKEIEIGGSPTSSAAETTSENSNATADIPADEKSKTDATQGAADKTDPNAQEKEDKNRYLMVRVSFDESLLGSRPSMPTEPAKPTAPEGYQPPPAIEKNGEETAQKSDTPAQQPEDDAAPNPADKPDRSPEFLKHDQELADFEQQKIEYELAVSRFEQSTKAFDTKITGGKKLIDELNQRFGDWYYVVTASNLKTLQTERKDLVTPKTPAGNPNEVIPAQPAIPTKPDISFPPSELDDEK